MWDIEATTALLRQMSDARTPQDLLQLFLAHATCRTLDAELAAAASVQRWLLPSPSPPTADVRWQPDADAAQSRDDAIDSESRP